MRARLAWLPLAVVLLAGCSLPLPGGVEAVGDVPAEQHEPVPLAVIPPGPRPGASAIETVSGFLGAEASSGGQHAIARQFLTARERARWRDDVEVQVYDPEALDVRAGREESTGATVVQVTARVLAQIRPDGSYVTRPGDPVTEQYHLVRVAGQWRLDGVPDGLRLTPADRLRSYTARNVYYLATAGDDTTRRLVADRVFLPVGADLTRSLVSRLLRDPSQGIAGSVASAVPTGTRLGGVRRDADGVVTVDLTGPATPLPAQAAQDLSAQLVWTLRSLGPAFRGLRLRMNGSELKVPGEGPVQRADDWGFYDPEGLGSNPPYYFVSGHRLRSSDDLPSSPATAGQPGDGRAVRVDAVAVSPDRQQLALLDTSRPKSTVVRVGAPDARSFPVVASGAVFTSPSWGPGSQGLWLVRNGQDVVRVVGSSVRPVTVLGAPAGRLTRIAIARDGLHAALVAGGRLYVGRIEVVIGAPVIVDLAPVLPSLHAVTGVAWATTTELVVLGVRSRASQLVRVAVDGSSILTVSTAGLLPTQLAASPSGVVLVASGRLYVSTGGAFQQVVRGGASVPVFPG
jgi:hypothetical protein